MEKIKQILQELFLYTNKIEMAIKISIWIISWIGGILVLQNEEINNTLGCAYFIFSLSLLMEFVPQIGNKRHFGSKLIHTLFCICILIDLFMSINLLLGGNGDETYYNIMFLVSKIIIIYMAINFIILWLFGAYKAEIEIDLNHTFENEQKIFEEKLTHGYLGSVGDQNE